MQVGTSVFEAYNRTLRRVMWADFVDEQMRLAREKQYRASLIQQQEQRPEPSLEPRANDEVPPLRRAVA